MLYILNVAGLDFISSICYEVKVYYQYFVLVFVHDCGISFLDILMLNYWPPVSTNTQKDSLKELQQSLYLLNNWLMEPKSCPLDKGKAVGQ